MRRMAPLYSGAECVLSSGTPQMQRWSAENLDSVKSVRQHMLALTATLRLLFIVSTGALADVDVVGFSMLYLLSKVTCTGNERRLADCLAERGPTQCVNFQDAVTYCNSKLIQLQIESVFCLNIHAQRGCDRLKQLFSIS